MRKLFDLDLKTLDRATFLFHGNYGVGKTHLLGDALRHESQIGPVKFVNITGEDGQLSIANFGLGKVGETVETLQDLTEALTEYKKANLRALAVDGGKYLGKMVIKAVCGDRLPSVGRGSNDWQEIHAKFENVIGQLRWVAPIVILASSSDRSMDQVSGELSLTPDLPGRQAAGVAGMFDFVFTLKAVAVGPNQIRRTIETAPSPNVITRSRLPRPLPASIEIPANGGGWKKLMEEIQKCLAPVK